VRCVIVDDNSLFFEGAADLLRREGLDVVGVASNSAAAISTRQGAAPGRDARRHRLGDEDGFELAQRRSFKPMQIERNESPAITRRAQSRMTSASSGRSVRLSAS
jgi:DNA-binding NarL/FixJ family response regulator